MSAKIVVRSTGDFKGMQKFLQKHTKDKNHYEEMLKKYGEMGVEALRAATPVDSGLTRDSWGYEVRTSQRMGYYSIIWTNSNVKNDWANVAVLIQYGHATRNGGYVQGIDYINPALKPVFDRIAKELWKEVSGK